MNINIDEIETITIKLKNGTTMIVKLYDREKARKIVMELIKYGSP